MSAAILGAIPVALPATFTLASAVGAQTLAKVGVLPTRLSAVDEAATMDVLCADKTGTLTANELTVAEVHVLPGYDEAHLLALAALASSEGGKSAPRRSWRSSFRLTRRRKCRRRRWRRPAAGISASSRARARW